MQITIGAAAAVPWISIAQIAVTAVSAGTALVAAIIAARAYAAGRADRKASEVDELTIGIVDAWKAEKAMERAGQAFNPMLKEAERARLRASALAEIANVSHRSIWPSEIDFAVIEARRLIEDTDVASNQKTLELAVHRLDELRRDILKGVKTLQAVNASLASEILGKKRAARLGTMLPMSAARFARGNVAVQMSSRLSDEDLQRERVRNRR